MLDAVLPSVEDQLRSLLSGYEEQKTAVLLGTTLLGDGESCWCL